MFRYIIAVILLASSAFAETYSWVDKQGVMHFTDQAESVPSSDMNNVTKSDDISKPTPKKRSKSTSGSFTPTTRESRLEEIRNRKFPVLKVGMSLNDVIGELGMYEKVNTSEGAYGSRKQYIFDNIGTWYVYITNGKVTSWQTSN